MSQTLVQPSIGEKGGDVIHHTLTQRKPTPPGIPKIEQDSFETREQIAPLLGDEVQIDKKTLNIIIPSFKNRSELPLGLTISSVQQWYQQIESKETRQPSNIEIPHNPNLCRESPLIRLDCDSNLLAYRADLERDADTLFALYQQLSFKGNPNQKANPSQEDWKDWWRGWLVYVPQKLEEVRSGIRDNRFYYTAIDDQEYVVAFMLAKCLGSGLSTEDIEERHSAMCAFQEDALSEEYLKNPANFQKIAWMEIAGVNSEYARKGIITDLEILTLQELYNTGVIEHAIGEILIAPYTNIGSIRFHEEKFAAVPICTRIQNNTLFGNKERTATWKVYEWKVFYRLVEARQKGILPEKIEDFNVFKLAYLCALHRQEFSGVLES